MTTQRRSVLHNLISTWLATEEGEGESQKSPSFAPFRIYTMHFFAHPQTMGRDLEGIARCRNLYQSMSVSSIGENSRGTEIQLKRPH